MNITIIIPTRNRYDEIKKIVKYYQFYKYTGKIFIIDSSEKKIYLRSKNFLLRNKNINIKHFRYVGRPFECTKFIIPKIKTKYVCWSGDDDFYIVDGLKKSIHIMSKNLRIDALNSLSLVANVKKNNFYIRYSIYDHFNSTYKSPVLRITKILNNYKVPIFSIFRANIFKKSFNFIPGKSKRNLCPTRIIHDEYLESLIFAFFNKIYKFDFPYMIRTVPEKKYAKKSIDLLKRNENLSLDQKKSFSYLEKTILKLIKNKNDKKLFIKKFNNFVKKINSEKQKYPLLMKSLGMHLRKIYVKFSNKNFGTFKKIIIWLENN